MTSRSILSCVVALLIIVGVASAALAGGDLPGPIATELTQYPGSTVLNGSSLPGGNYIANMNFGQASVSDVYNYYKAKMIENGFTIQTEVQGTTIIAKKGDMDAVVDLDTRNGATVGTLSITGKTGGQASTGGAPPAAPPAIPQVATPPAAAPSSPGNLSIGTPGGQAKYHARTGRYRQTISGQPRHVQYGKWPGIQRADVLGERLRRGGRRLLQKRGP